MRLTARVRRCIKLVGAAICGLLIPLLLTAAIPTAELAKVWQSQENIADFLVSEKLDGVRARWDGRQLLSRSGLVIAAPAWFTDGFPPIVLEGELWAGYGSFEQVSVAARSNSDQQVWRSIKLYLFDAPTLAGSFAARYKQFAAYDQLTPYLRVIPQRRLEDSTALQHWLKTILDRGGEGLMLHRQDAVYTSGRSGNLFKLKAIEDDEARVLAILPGKGKYQGMMGALLVETAAGVQFRIGTGFTDAERKQPPAIGSWVTFAYSGVTSKGKPRFARFLRVRLDYQLTHGAENQPVGKALEWQSVPDSATESF